MQALPVWRYLTSMKLLLSVVLVPIVLSGTWQAPLFAREIEGVQSAPERRRAELRQALKTVTARETPGNKQSVDGTAPARHLSAQELADLRQQLRQGRREQLKPAKP